MVVVNEMVKNVQVNGTSVVSNGVANVPVAGNNVAGIVKLASNSGIAVYGDGILRTTCAGVATIKWGVGSRRRNTNRIRQRSHSSYCC